MKKLVAVFIFLALISVFSFQASTVKAVSSNVTITAPITFFGLRGKIEYHNLGRLIGNAKRVFPAANVLVTITNFFNHSSVVTTTTDSNGNYAVPLNPGLYEIKVSDSNHTLFSPPIRVVDIKKNVRDASFVGLVFPH